MLNNKNVVIKICFQCNNLCRFCVQGNKRYNIFCVKNNKIHRPLNKKKKEIKILLKKEKLNNNGVIFTGGEPTIDKNLIQYIKYAKKLGYKVIQIQTNGRMLAYKEYCLELINAGANNFLVAIHGSTAEIHDCLTQSPGSFNETLQGIKNLKKLNQTVIIKTVITKINYKDLPNIAKMMTVLKVKNIIFTFMKTSEWSNNKEVKNGKTIIPRYYRIKKYLKKSIDIGFGDDIIIKIENIPYCFIKGYENHLNNNIYEKCEGVGKDYSNIFGWKEFKPIKH